MRGRAFLPLEELCKGFDNAVKAMVGNRRRSGSFRQRKEGVGGCCGSAGALTVDRNFYITLKKRAGMKTIRSKHYFLGIVYFGFALGFINTYLFTRESGGFTRSSMG